MSDDLITINEAAEACRLSTKTIRRHIASGVLPAYRIGPRAVRLKRRDLDAVMRPIPSATSAGYRSGHSAGSGHRP